MCQQGASGQAVSSGPERTEALRRRKVPSSPGAFMEAGYSPEGGVCGDSSVLAAGTAVGKECACGGRGALPPQLPRRPRTLAALCSRCSHCPLGAAQEQLVDPRAGEDGPPPA